MAGAREQQVELLERAISEVDALEAIYGCGDDAGDDDAAPTEDDHGGPSFSASGFALISRTEAAAARRIAEGRDEGAAVPLLELEIEMRRRGGGGNARLRFQMPPGYPERPARVSAFVEGLARRRRDALSESLSEVAEELSGSECVMALVDAFKVLAAQAVAEEERKDERNGRQQGPKEGSLQLEEDRATASPATRGALGRRWVWVHHVTDPGRRKSILREAHDLDLGGYLKSGHPGNCTVFTETAFLV